MQKLLANEMYGNQGMTGFEYDNSPQTQYYMRPQDSSQGPQGTGSNPGTSPTGDPAGNPVIDPYNGGINGGGPNGTHGGGQSGAGGANGGGTPGSNGGPGQGVGLFGERNVDPSTVDYSGTGVTPYDPQAGAVHPGANGGGSRGLFSASTTPPAGGPITQGDPTQGQGIQGHTGATMNGYGGSTADINSILAQQAQRAHAVQANQASAAAQNGSGFHPMGGDHSATVTPSTPAPSAETNPDGTAMYSPTTVTPPPYTTTSNPVSIAPHPQTPPPAGAPPPADPNAPPPIPYSLTEPGPQIGTNPDGTPIYADPSNAWNQGGASGNRQLAGGQAYNTYSNLVNHPEVDAATKNAVEQQGTNAARSQYAGAADQIDRQAAATHNSAGVLAAKTRLGQAEAGTLSGNARQNQMDFYHQKLANQATGATGLSGLYQGESNYLSGLFNQRAGLTAKPLSQENSVQGTGNTFGGNMSFSI